MLAAIAIFFFHPQSMHQWSVWIEVLLLLMAVMMKTIMDKLKLGDRPLLIGVAVFLLLGTFSIVFSLAMLAVGFGAKLLYRQPTISVDEQSISRKKITGTKRYQWRQFENIILKDNLLTLDFRNNKVLQLEIMDQAQPTDESRFKQFCELHLSE